jgi:RsiW-degrading membrane proteinase PrsW (M82 family)
MSARRRLAWLVVVVLLATLCWRGTDTPLPIILAALAPAGIYAVLVALLDQREREPASLLIAAFLWGAAVAASAASTVNGLLQMWMSAGSTGSEASALVSRLGAPVVEELAKGSALLVLVMVWPRQLAGVRDGIVYGALVGLGFAASENLLYLTMAALQGGYAGLLRSVYLRGAVYGVNHAVFTATTGAAVGYARATTSRTLGIVVPLAGLVAAVALHMLWNTVASDAIGQVLCAAPVAGGACQDPPPAHILYVTVPLMVALFIGPCIAVLLTVGMLSRDRPAGSR